MSIKIRLLVSYIAMIIVPVILFALVAGMMGSLFLNDMVGGSGDQKGTPLFSGVFNQRDELFAGVKFMAQTDPDRFNDDNFLRNTDEQLNKLEAGLVLVKNHQISFSSPFVNSVDNTTLYEKLVQLQAEENHRRWRPDIDNRFTVVKYDFTFSDKSPGTVYLLSDMSPFIDKMGKFFPMLVLSLLVIIALTNGILTYLVSRSIIKPLYELKHAAEQIKEGNLDHEVKLTSKDEIGQLGAAFEEMRLRLNESIRLQLQYEENRKELLSNISHDLKTPITGIQACVEGIRDGIADTGPKRDKYLGMIAKKTEEMARLIDELFLFSKLDLKRVSFHLEPLDLTNYLHDCVEEFRLDPRMDGITISFVNAGNKPVHVLADREKLHRVITNIMDNSLKYMNKQEKQINIELIDGEEEATVKIKDNGQGIESAALPHIFERFYRVEPSRNKETGGSGLGLAIVKQIVQGNGGSVWADSQMGEGTSIYFTLRKIDGGERS